MYTFEKNLISITIIWCSFLKWFLYVWKRWLYIFISIQTPALWMCCWALHKDQTSQSPGEPPGVQVSKIKCPHWSLKHRKLARSHHQTVPQYFGLLPRMGVGLGHCDQWISVTRSILIQGGVAFNSTFFSSKKCLFSRKKQKSFSHFKARYSRWVRVWSTPKPTVLPKKEQGCHTVVATNQRD